MLLNEQFEELKHSGKLPTPSGVGLRILVQTRTEDCSLDEIARTLQADPALTGCILKLANSAISGGVSPATNVRDAGVRLGLRTVCNVALGFSLIATNRVGRCVAFDYDTYWSWSLANGVAAEILSRNLSLGSPGEAFTLGLLTRIGRLALASVHPAQYTSLLTRLAADRTLELSLLERETFCIQHREVGAAITEDWGLPPVFSEVMLHFGLRIPETLDWPESKTYLGLLATTLRLADVLVGGHDAAVLWPAAREAMVELGVAREDCQHIYDEVGERWKEWGQLLRVPADFSVRAKEVEARSSVAVELPLGPKPLKNSSLRILVVDDEPTSLRMVEALLTRAGHQVTTARHGQEALTKALQDPPQMVVTDWMMPGMDGVELCKRLRSTDAGRDLYILILTGQNEEERIVETLEAGADDHVGKPINTKLLLARIRPGLRVVQLQERLQGEMREKDEANARLAIEKRKFKVASMTDALTELPNRRYAMKRLEKEWATSQRANLPLSVILLDIDHFKLVNDTFGHDVGDQVLIATSKAISKVLRTSDTCTRMGGEEFLIICPGTPLEGAQNLAERIRAAVEANEVQVPSFTQRVVRVSLGVACNTSQGSASIDTLLKASDEAVYLAKRLGRNCVSLPPGVQSDRKSA
ncbi:MAG: diguanylate cyclase [Planctomycetes bacterium]|nr:diguanylate cyclase [Planctomycetota bacterium]